MNRQNALRPLEVFHFGHVDTQSRIDALLSNLPGRTSPLKLKKSRSLRSEEFHLVTKSFNHPLRHVEPPRDVDDFRDVVKSEGVDENVVPPPRVSRNRANVEAPGSKEQNHRSEVVVHLVHVSSIGPSLQTLSLPTAMEVEPHGVVGELLSEDRHQPIVLICEISVAEDDDVAAGRNFLLQNCRQPKPLGRGNCKPSLWVREAPVGWGCHGKRKKPPDFLPSLFGS
mmetsp:Transcript_39281/g.77271  ORF Transcript_39281/g.77271 Transcript_39281/m.77271 type:complete len:226 (+) Transcript_39281:354-1031(+)